MTRAEYRDRIEQVVPLNMLEAATGFVPYFTQPKKGGKPGLDKLPGIAADPGGWGSSSDPSTWTDVRSALDAFMRHGRFAGIGYVLHEGDELFCIDVDGVVDAGTGEFTNPSAESFVRRFAETYIEYSPSRTGVHIWGRASKSTDSCVGWITGADGKKFKVEFYGGGVGGGRLMTLTGDQVPGSGVAAADCQALVDELEGELFPAKKARGEKNAVTVDPGLLSLSVQDRLELAFKSKNGAAIEALYRGDTSGYGGDHSSADLALVNHLAFWLPHPDELDAVFRSSGLMREKWDSKRGASTYGAWTIEKALGDLRDTYSPKGSGNGNGVGGGTGASVVPPLGSASKSNVKTAAETSTLASAAGLDETVTFPSTQVGNAQRLVARHGGDLRYAYERELFFAWNGRCWEADQSGQVARWAKKVSRDLLRFAEALPDDPPGQGVPKPKRAALTHAKQAESAAGLRAMLELASTEEGVPISVSEFDADPWVFNCLNGTLDLTTGELRPHRREDLLSKLAPVVYDPEAPCPLFEWWIEDRFDGNGELVAYVQRAIGYSMTGVIREHVVFVPIGGGGDGKSTLVDLVHAFVGPYGQVCPSSLMIEGRGEASIPNDVARLVGARFGTLAEGSRNVRINEAKLKRLSGGDRQVGRFLGREFFEFEPQVKLWLTSNERPTIRGTDEGIWRRIQLIPFPKPIEKVDTTFDQRLLAELPGILAWAVRGCLDWQKQGLNPPDAVVKATQEYRREQDPVGRFLEDRCLVDPKARVVGRLLFDAWCSWCNENNETVGTHTALTQELLRRRLPRTDGRGEVRAESGSNGKDRYLAGIGLR